MAETGSTLAYRRAASLLWLATQAMAATAADHTVTIDAMQFAPATLTVQRGDRITWVNRDLVPHTASAAPAFDSGPIAPTHSWRWTATKPGHYHYACTLHPTMKAELVVE